MAIISNAVLLVAVASCGISCALIMPAILFAGNKLKGRAQITDRLQGKTANKKSLMRSLFRNGLPLFAWFSKAAINNTWIARQLNYFVKALSINGYSTNAKVISELLLALILVLVAAITLLTQTLLIAVFCVVGLFIALSFKAQKAIKKWDELLNEQVPEALRTISVCFGAGFSLQQAFEQTANDTPEPLGFELKQASFDINAGKSVEEALSDLEARANTPDIGFAIVALEIQHRTGGSLQDLLESAADAMIASFDLRRQLAVQTAQARLSAKVVTMLPLILVALLSVAMEGYLQTFFSSFEGMMILFVALAMEGLGILMVRRILGVNLD